MHLYFYEVPVWRFCFLSRSFQAVYTKGIYSSPTISSFFLCHAHITVQHVVRVLHLRVSSFHKALSCSLVILYMHCSIMFIHYNKMFVFYSIGWNLTLEYCISSAAIARSWGDYFSYFWVQWGFDPPHWLNSISIGFTELSPAAAFIVLLCTVVMLFGISTSSTFNVIITIVNIGILLFFIGVGACSVYPEFWTYTHDSFVPYGAASLFSGAGTVFFSYLGFDMVSSLAEETKNSEKNLPRGIIGSLGIAVAIYVGVCLVATGLVPFQFIVSAQAPLAKALELRGLAWAGKVITFGSLFGLTATTFTCLLGQPRIFYTMARDVRSYLHVLFHLNIYNIISLK